MSDGSPFVKGKTNWLWHRWGNPICGPVWLRGSQLFLQYPHHGQPICRSWETTSSSLQMSISSVWKGFQSSRTSGTFKFSLTLFNSLIILRRDTYEPILAKNPSSVLIHLARSAFPAQTNSLVTLVYTTMIILPVTFYIQQYLPKDQQKLRSIFQCQMTLLLLPFPVPETLVHLTIKRHLGRKRRQEVVLTVMTRYQGVSIFISFSYAHISSLGRILCSSNSSRFLWWSPLQTQSSTSSLSIYRPLISRHGRALSPWTRRGP